MNTELHELLEQALAEAEISMDIEQAITMLDQHMEELELLEAKIGKAVVTIDDLRALLAARQKRIAG
ncbi:MAG: hypothetical protein H6868_03115 [Rhodospirillales bacterium]|nr:hypothetical protein [Rhodospirillales bacterium]